MVIGPILLIAAVCYLAGGLIRAFTILGVCLVVLFFLKHMSWLEFALAVAVVTLLASKGWISAALQWFDDWLKAPIPPYMTEDDKK